MAKLSSLLAFVARAVVAGLAVAFVVVYLWPAAVDTPGKGPLTTPESQPTPASYADAVDRAAPAVVSINLDKVLIRSGRTMLDHYRLRRVRADGSGVILRPDGYIITNHHVIHAATDITVSLWDDRLVPARVVGSDPDTDLAVLKVDLEGLPVAPVAEGNGVRVGDIVLAIGNALGLSHTVSLGIVSATGRNDLLALRYQDFIQTDAAINAGNSGGALVNTRGELVGINSRRADLTKGAQNIGFAIPAKLARDVMDQIIDYGTVRRGWMGARYSDLRPTMQPDGSSIRMGVGILDVDRGGPAWSAGIRPGDVILSLDGDPVSDASRFLLAISQRVPGSKVELEVIRGAESFQTYATLMQQPPL